jgi:hypothetical protein
MNIELPCFGIKLNLTGDGGGAISSDLKEEYTEDDYEFGCNNKMSYNGAVDGLESIILAHACAGIDIQSPAYIEGIETAVQAISNAFDSDEWNDGTVDDYPHAPCMF